MGLDRAWRCKVAREGLEQEAGLTKPSDQDDPSQRLALIQQLLDLPIHQLKDLDHCRTEHLPYYGPG